MVAISGSSDRVLGQVSGWGVGFPEPFRPYRGLRMASTAHRMCFCLKSKLQTDLSSPIGANWTVMPSSGGEELGLKGGESSVTNIPHL